MGMSFPVKLSHAELSSSERTALSTYSAKVEVTYDIAGDYMPSTRVIVPAGAGSDPVFSGKPGVISTRIGEVNYHTMSWTSFEVITKAGRIAAKEAEEMTAKMTRAITYRARLPPVLQFGGATLADFSAWWGGLGQADRVSFQEFTRGMARDNFRAHA
jgi:hypothetical protein